MMALLHGSLQLAREQGIRTATFAAVPQQRKETRPCSWQVTSYALRHQYHGTDRKPAFQVPMRLSNVVQRVVPDIFDADDALSQSVEQFRSGLVKYCAVRYVMETHGSCHGR